MEPQPKKLVWPREPNWLSPAATFHRSHSDMEKADSRLGSSADAAGTSGPPAAADLPLALARMAVDPASPLPLYKQICRMLRMAISTGDLPAGLVLPTSHELAASLEVSRNTIVTVYSLLAAEGLLSSNTRRGTRVADVPVNRAPSTLRKQDLDLPSRQRPTRQTPALPSPHPQGDSKSAGEVAALAATQTPDPSNSPMALGRCIAREFGSPPKPALALRQFQYAICTFLRRARGMQCEPEQVMPVRSLKHALDLVGRILIDPGHWAYVEDPSDGQALRSLHAAGAQVLPISGDVYGADISKVHGPSPRIVVVSPSANFPSGHQMSDTRRTAMLETADRTGAFIFEDDRWCEISYSGRQSKPIQARNPGARVLYFGSLQESLGPQIKAAYLVVPFPLIRAFSRAQRAEAIPGPFVLSALAAFITSPDFAHHLQSVRSAYSQRLSILVEACRRSLRDAVILEPAGGLALPVQLHREIDEEAVCRAGASLNAALAPLSSSFHFAADSTPRGIIIGLGTVSERSIDILVSRISEAVHEDLRIARAA